MRRLMCTEDVLDSPGRVGLAALRKGGAALLLSLSALFGGASGVCAQGFADPLDTPAIQYRSSFDSLPIQALASPGDGQLIAVGLRGVILRSEDAGATWSQVPTPVSSDLLAVSFVSPRQGWAVGQDGVVLASADGGNSWNKQFDGRALESLTRYYREATQLDAQVREELQQQLQTNLGAGPVLPFLSVHFLDADHGLASGPFGMLIASEDGGRHWRPALHQIDNPEFLHLNAIAQVGDHLFIASEQGIVFKADVRRRHFEALQTGHVGSFFSIAGHGGVLLAGGLGGVLYASHDQGAHWRALQSPLTQLVSRIEFDAQAQRFTAVTTGGEVLSLSADLREVQPGGLRAPILSTDLVSLPQGMLFASLRGLQRGVPVKLQAQRGEQ
ncbi:WD40/YVTN/BNR-like repeat-containing protein [Pseudomonas aeruginosa]|uniref:WD40/YVTN/BNR-like repeat-containing protein n=1 Tax=Pseudomonas aeruginosa TaxID=287 RepID=UPI0006915847|nr:YCF48-related protein [Pseudomonas aeruginosa]